MQSTNRSNKVYHSKVAPKLSNDISKMQLTWQQEISYCWLKLGKHPQDIKEAV